MDVNLPRDKTTGKTRGFGFLMYEDQRSTVLAVDNLNGATILERTIRVDHVNQYKQPGEKDEKGEWKEPIEQSLNAKPEMMDGKLSRRPLGLMAHTETFFVEGYDSDGSTVSSLPSIDPEDPMRDYLLAKRKEESKEKKKKSKGKRKREDETPEERKARKARKREKKERERRSKLLEASESSDRRRRGDRDGGGERSPLRRRSRSPDRDYRSRRSRSRSPVGRRH
jgi:RNA-binding motif X-linked protein 2